MVQHHAEQFPTNGQVSKVPSICAPDLTDAQPEASYVSDEKAHQEPSGIVDKNDDSVRTYAFKDEQIEHSAPRLKPEALESIVGFEYAMLA